MQNFKIPCSLNLSRLDKAISSLILDHSRSFIQKMITSGNVKVNDVIICDRNFKVKENDVVEYTSNAPSPSDMKATNIPINVVYEDDYLLVINKPAGLTVHPGAGNYENTLANALLYHFNSLSSIGGADRPGIVHRLDKDTSGLIIIAKTNHIHSMLAAQLADHSLIRKYQALIWGVLTPLNGTIEGNITRDKINRKKMAISKFSGKKAISHYRTEMIYQNGLMSLIECRLETGRTHQIRVHFNSVGHSIIGDQTYGNNSKKIAHCTQHIKELLVNFKRQALHSSYIRFFHPHTKDFLEFSIELPYDMKHILNNI